MNLTWVSDSLTGLAKCASLKSLQARSSVWLERYLDTVEVNGSSPFGPTNVFNHLRRHCLPDILSVASSLSDLFLECDFAYASSATGSLCSDFQLLCIRGGTFPRASTLVAESFFQRDRRVGRIQAAYRHTYRWRSPPTRGMARTWERCLQRCFTGRRSGVSLSSPFRERKNAPSHANELTMRRNMGQLYIRSSVSLRPQSGSGPY